MTTTAIESKLKREGGTVIPFGPIVYHFVPYTDGAHVCNVDNTEHADRLLSITEGYGLYRGNGVPVGPLKAAAPALAARAAVEAPVAAPVATPAALLMGDYPDTFVIHGETYLLQNITAKALANSGLDVQAWNDLPADRRDDLIDAELDALEAAGPADADDPRPALVAQYVELFGKKPHYNLGVAKLREMIEAQSEAKHS